MFPNICSYSREKHYRKTYFFPGPKFKYQLLLRDPVVSDCSSSYLTNRNISCNLLVSTVSLAYGIKIQFPYIFDQHPLCANTGMKNCKSTGFRYGKDPTSFR